MQKFCGVGSEAKLGEWKLQIETMLSFQPLSDSQKADFILGLLEGEAKRDFDWVGKQEYPQENI